MENIKIYYSLQIILLNQLEVSSNNNILLLDRFFESIKTEMEVQSIGLMELNALVETINRLSNKDIFFTFFCDVVKEYINTDVVLLSGVIENSRESAQTFDYIIYACKLIFLLRPEQNEGIRFMHQVLIEFGPNYFKTEYFTRAELIANAFSTEAIFKDDGMPQEYKLNYRKWMFPSLNQPKLERVQNKVRNRSTPYSLYYQFYSKDDAKLYDLYLSCKYYEYSGLFLNLSMYPKREYSDRDKEQINASPYYQKSYNALLSSKGLPSIARLSFGCITQLGLFLQNLCREYARYDGFARHYESTIDTYVNGFFRYYNQLSLSDQETLKKEFLYVSYDESERYICFSTLWINLKRCDLIQKIKFLNRIACGLPEIVIQYDPFFKLDDISENKSPFKEKLSLCRQSGIKILSSDDIERVKTISLEEIESFFIRVFLCLRRQPQSREDLSDNQRIILTRIFHLKKGDDLKYYYIHWLRNAKLKSKFDQAMRPIHILTPAQIKTNLPDYLDLVERKSTAFLMGVRDSFSRLKALDERLKREEISFFSEACIEINQIVYNAFSTESAREIAYNQLKRANKKKVDDGLICQQDNQDSNYLTSMLRLTS